jgi:Icc protein
MKILQLTDSHLFANDNQEIFGVKTNLQFYRLIDFIRQQKLEFDSIFLTGDMSQDCSVKSYEILIHQLTPLAKPVYWIPGNHDKVHVMREVLSQNKLFKCVDHAILDGWAFVFLNTVKGGFSNWLLHYLFKKQDPRGALNTKRLELLKKLLTKLPPKLPVCLVMHHHPAPVGNPLIDKYMLEKHGLFWETLVQTHRPINLIMCGHVHGAYDIQTHNTRLISSPATCLQFAAGDTKAAIESRKKSGCTLWDFGKEKMFSYERIFIN